MLLSVVDDDFAVSGRFIVGKREISRARSGVIGAGLLLASVVGVVPGLAGAADAPQPDAEPFVDVSDGSVDFMRAQVGAGVANGPDVSRGLRFNRVAMRSALAGAPTVLGRGGLLTIDLPAPDGSMVSFNVWESEVMAPELAAVFPEITTYAGQGVDDPAATIVFDVTPHGFHAQVLSPSGAWYIDPAAMGDDVVHESFFRSDRGSPQEAFIEGNAVAVEQLEDSGPEARVAARSGTQLRTLRTAVSATSPYTSANGGTRALAQASIVTAVNRVSGIYVTEISTQLQLVGGNDNLVYVSKSGLACDFPSADKDCDPFFNSDIDIDTNQLLVDDIIGDANYDLGHVFTTQSGLAGLGVVGVVGEKAMGTTGTGTANDLFYVDYVAHEMGHQLGGSHTFNGANCAAGTASGARANRVEPGSGSTIQAYAGICGPDDLQQANSGQSGDGTNASDPYFHSRSFDQIMTRLGQITVGTTATGNTVPTASAGLDVTIPAQTPFFLTATGSDANGDALTYHFEQRDGGTVSALSNPEIASGPLFRSFPPTTSRTSFFPRLSEVAAGNTNQNVPCAAPDGSKTKALCWAQYLVPTGTSRAMNFRATVRDNYAGGGGVNTDDTVVTVEDAAGPFTLRAPNGDQNLSGSTTVTWDVGGSASLPGAATVSVRMSTDGGLTFPTELVANTPNDGSQTVLLSNVNSSKVRLMVHSGDFTNGSGFFDISDANFTTTAFDFTPMAPLRLLETRIGPELTTFDGDFEGEGRLIDGDIVEFKVTGRRGIPDGAVAASLNVVAIFADAPGFLTVYSCDEDRPEPAASVNYDGDDVRPNAVLTKLSTTGTVCIYTLRATDLVVDVNGTFAAGSGFDSMAPLRLLETRIGPELTTFDGDFEGEGRLIDGDIVEFKVTGRRGIPDGAVAASLNVVAIFADAPGFLTVYSCDEDRPEPAASVNYDGDDVRPNAVLTKLSTTGTVCIYTLRGTDIVVDVNGVFI